LGLPFGQLQAVGVVAHCHRTAGCRHDFCSAAILLFIDRPRLVSRTPRNNSGENYAEILGGVQPSLEEEADCTLATNIPIQACGLSNPLTVRELYCDKGLSLSEIARTAGTSKSHVYYYMTKFHIERRPWTGWTTKQDPSLILQLYRDEGKTSQVDFGMRTMNVGQRWVPNSKDFANKSGSRPKRSSWERR
jgi:hypothetical protein